jgi:hypothetical protein
MSSIFSGAIRGNTSASIDRRSFSEALLVEPRIDWLPSTRITFSSVIEPAARIICSSCCLVIRSQVCAASPRRSKPPQREHFGECDHLPRTLPIRLSATWSTEVRATIPIPYGGAHSNICPPEFALLRWIQVNPFDARRHEAIQSPIDVPVRKCARCRHPGEFLHHPPCSASQRSASMAAWHPIPAAVTAWR